MMELFGPLFVVYVFAAIVSLFVWALIFRWMFRINHIVKTLESIDESLKQLPVVKQSQNRRAA